MAIEHVQRGWRVGAQQRAGDIEEKRVFHAAEHAVDILRGDVIPAKSEALVGKGQRVAHAALRRARDQRKSAVFDGDARAGEHVRQRTLDIGYADAVKVEPLAAGDDRRWEFLRFCGGEDKENMFRRLFERFEQRVERGTREHVNLVDDVYAAAEPHRRVLRVFD